MNFLTNDTNKEFTTNKSDIDTILTNETNQNKCEPWSKLIKTAKIQKLIYYAEQKSDEQELSDSEVLAFKKYLIACLERKRLVSVKDVIYDNENGVIKSIPCLTFNASIRKYTLKRSDKRASTLKSLGNGKMKAKSKMKSTKLKKIDVNIKDKPRE